MSVVLYVAAGGVALLAFYSYTRPGVNTSTVSEPSYTPTPTTTEPAPEPKPPITPAPEPIKCDYSLFNINKLRIAAGLAPLPEGTKITPKPEPNPDCSYIAETITRTTTTTTTTAPPPTTDGHCEVVNASGVWSSYCRTKAQCTGSSQLRWVPGPSSLGAGCTFPY